MKKLTDEEIEKMARDEASIFPEGSKEQTVAGIYYERGMEAARSFYEGHADEKETGWDKMCECSNEAKIGETWCCNNCGRPTSVRAERIETPVGTNRLEVIDGKGRSYVNWKPANKISLSWQDSGKTLKIFITEPSQDNTKQ